MATKAKVDLQQKTADADAWVITGAAIAGATEGIQKVADDKINLAKKIIEPGDQRNIEHPLDDLITSAKSLTSDISNTWQAATAAGDMNIKHSQARQPHPIDKAATTLAATYETLAEKGPVEGTREASAMIVAGIAETVISPSSKVKKIEAIADITSDTKAINSAEQAIQGEYIAANEANRAIANSLSEHITEAKTGIKDKFLSNPAVKMFSDVFNPPLDTRIALEAHKARPNTLDYIDETHKPGGDVEALHAENIQRIHRAEKLGEVIRDNPALMAQNSKISDEQIRALINDSSSDRRLGLEHNAAAIPKLPSREEQLRIDAHNERKQQAQTAADIATHGTDGMTTGEKIVHHLANNVRGYTGLGYDVGKGELARLEAAALESDSAFIKEGIKTGARKVITTALIVKALTVIVLADEKPVEEKSIGRPLSDNEKEALKFVNAHLGGETPEAKAASMRQLQTSHPTELNKAVDMYLTLQSHLMKDGQLSEQDAGILKQATASITGKLAAGEPVADKSQNLESTANLELERVH